MKGKLFSYAMLLAACICTVNCCTKDATTLGRSQYFLIDTAKLTGFNQGKSLTARPRLNLEVEYLAFN